MEHADLAVGDHEFHVRATDLHGNTEDPPVTYGWTIVLDTTPPETTLHARPAASTLDTTATFTFSSNEAGAEFECSLDGAAYEGCSSPEEYTELVPGEHTFAVARRRPGRADPERRRHPRELHLDGGAGGGHDTA